MQALSLSKINHTREKLYHVRINRARVERAQVELAGVIKFSQRSLSCKSVADDLAGTFAHMRK